MSSRRGGVSGDDLVELLTAEPIEGEPEEPETEPPSRFTRWWAGYDRPARLALVATAVAFLVAGLLVLAGTQRPIRVVERVVTVNDPVPVSGVDAVGCPARRSCLVRSARLAAYIANARTTIALDVAGSETVDRTTGDVYRRVLSEFRDEPAVSVHLIFQCVPNGALTTTATYARRDGTASAGHFSYSGSRALPTGPGCSAQYNYSVDSSGPFEPDLLKLDVLIVDSSLWVTP